MYNILSGIKGIFNSPTVTNGVPLSLKRRQKMKKRDELIKKFFLMLFSAVVFSAAAGPARADYPQLSKLTASDAAAGDFFGWSVALSGSIVLVGAYWDDDACPSDPGCNSGSAYLFDVVTGRQITKLTASDAATNDRFGYSVAISGSTALVGANRSDAAGGESGSAYLFDFSDPCNITETKLTASDAAAGDEFGHSVAISGTTALVGAPFDDDACPGDIYCNSGSAYLFDFSDPCNIIETKLTASGLFGIGAEARDYFGDSVAVSGSIALVGAKGKFYNDRGLAYLFDAATGSQIAYLYASDAAGADNFGSSVALSGTTALVGASYDDDAGNNSGSAYLFDFSDPCYIIETKLTASDAAADDAFGHSVALSGSTALVGANGNDAAGERSGSAYLFDFSDSDPCYIIETRLTASDAANSDFFGYSVALSGVTALVGAFGNDDAGSASGSAYLFCVFPPVGDNNRDCRVDLRDFALMAGNWLVNCLVDPSDPACLAP